MLIIRLRTNPRFILYKEKLISIEKKKLDQKPEQTIRNVIRAQGLKWNALRQEWYGYAHNLEKLKTDLKGISFKLDIIKQ